MWKRTSSHGLITSSKFGLMLPHLRWETENAIICGLEVHTKVWGGHRKKEYLYRVLADSAFPCFHIRVCMQFQHGTALAERLKSMLPKKITLHNVVGCSPPAPWTIIRLHSLLAREGWDTHALHDGNGVTSLAVSLMHSCSQPLSSASTISSFKAGWIRKHAISTSPDNEILSEWRFPALPTSSYLSELDHTTINVEPPAGLGL